jgi:hypothetical protein
VEIAWHQPSIFMNLLDNFLVSDPNVPRSFKNFGCLAPITKIASVSDPDLPKKIPPAGVEGLSTFFN